VRADGIPPNADERGGGGVDVPGGVARHRAALELTLAAGPGAARAPLPAGSARARGRWPSPRRASAAGGCSASRYNVWYGCYGSCARRTRVVMPPIRLLERKPLPWRHLRRCDRRRSAGSRPSWRRSSACFGSRWARRSGARLHGSRSGHEDERAVIARSRCRHHRARIICFVIYAGRQSNVDLRLPIAPPEKGTPVARPARKARGLSETARPPKKGPAARTGHHLSPEFLCP
jgi:hypothetical protein